MAKKSKSKHKEVEAEEHKETGPVDVFQLLFGGGAEEEPGLLRSVPNVTEKKRKKREKVESPHIYADEIGIGSEDSKKKKKEKVERKKKELSPNLGVESVGTDEFKKRKGGEGEIGDLRKYKKKGKEENDAMDVDVLGKDDVKEEGGVVGGDLKKKRRKRKRDEIEEEYEARKYGVALAGKEAGEIGKRVVGEKRKSVDDPAAMMVSKEGFDDESKLLRTVFVGNLPLKTKKKALLKEFCKFGEVESVRIRSVPIVDSKTPRKGAILKGKINEAVDSVHAYIVYMDEKSAQTSLSHNMAVVGGNHIRVDMACPPRKKLKGDCAPLYDNKRTVFVGNLPFDVKDEELYQLFCGINQLESSIEGIRVIRDPNTSIGKGVAYVLCKTRDAANLVLKKKHLKLRDRDLRLYHAKSDATGSKKRVPPPSEADNPAAKRLAVRIGGNDNKTKTTPSYQGLQASKSNKRKDGFRPKTREQARQKPKTVDVTDVKQRKSKRPAVAARKAKALKTAASPKQTGKRRKPESRTPESLKRNKKARRK